MGCNRGNAQPTAAHALQGKRSLGCRMRRRQRAAHSGCRATKFVLSFGSNQAMRSPQRRTHCKDTKFCVIISPYPLKMSRKNSASHFTLPRTQPCFPRPLVFFCLGDGISLTASAYRGIRSNAPQRNEILRHSDATKAMRSPQRRAHCRATKFLGMCDEGNAARSGARAA